MALAMKMYPFLKAKLVSIIMKISIYKLNTIYKTLLFSCIFNSLPPYMLDLHIPKTITHITIYDRS